MPDTTGASKKLRSNVIEASLIVFSVLLALFLDNVMQDRQDARDVAELTRHIADEIQSNLTIVNKWLPYHRQVVAEIDSYIASDQLLESLITADGIDYGRLANKGLIQDFYSDSAWQLAQQSLLSSRIDFGVSSAITDAYLAQQNVNGTLQRIVGFYSERETYDPKQVRTSLRILRNLVKDLAGQQTVLQHNCEAALAAIAAVGGD
ncbi:MAG: hypothetical protein AAGH76_17295 [Pseudomonadota bacterium]